MKPTLREPGRNTTFSVHFVIRGAEKRRAIAMNRAQKLQQELGVTPRLVCVK